MIETPAAAWVRCSPYIEAALAHAGGTHDIEDVRAGIEAGDFHLWAGQRCAVVTEIIDAPRLKTLNFWLLGGDLRELLHMRPVIEHWAREHGCGRVIGGGVHGAWARVLKSAGYRPRWTIFSKDLT